MAEIPARLPVKPNHPVWAPAGLKRQLNVRERSSYELYCDYCRERVRCKPAVDHLWYVVNQSIRSY